MAERPVPARLAFSMFGSEKMRGHESENGVAEENSISHTHSALSAVAGSYDCSEAVARAGALEMEPTIHETSRLRFEPLRFRTTTAQAEPTSRSLARCGVECKSLWRFLCGERPPNRRIKCVLLLVEFASYSWIVQLMWTGALGLGMESERRPSGRSPCRPVVANRLTKPTTARTTIPRPELFIHNRDQSWAVSGTK